MSDMPKAQNQEILSTLLKAYEHKELSKLIVWSLISNSTFYISYLGKLSQINADNSKILSKLNKISDGRILSVGHHQVHEESSRQKTLNVDRDRLVNEHIDYENRKISHAINTARPIVPLHNDY